MTDLRDPVAPVVPPGPALPERPPGEFTPRSRGWGRSATAAGSIIAIGVVIAVVLWQMHLSLLLSDTTTTGGDTGAHYMMPPFLQGLITHGHLTGWDPAWYDGFPIYTFYFVLPDALAAVGGWIIPYNIAFKWATVLGSITLPVAAWACARLFRLRPPVPAALAAATLPFLFDYSYTIYGGNLFSTLAGEYSYSLSISLALVFVGLVAYGQRTGRYRGWAAVVLALCVLAHIVPALWAIAGAGLLTLFDLLPRSLRPRDDVVFETSTPVRRRPSRGRGGVLAASRWRSWVRSWPERLLEVPSPPRSRPAVVWWTGSTVALGLLLSGWWLVPFGVRQPYSTSMGYENVTTYVHLLFPEADLWALLLAGVFVVLAVVRRSRFGLFLAIMGGLSAAALILDPQGSLYNVRLLPLWFLCVYLMVGWGFAVTCHLVALRWRRWRSTRWTWQVAEAFLAERPLPRRPRIVPWAPGAVGGALLAVLGALLVVIPPFILPADALPVGVGANQVTNWAAWNYSGYEGKPSYPEYQGVIHTMSKVGRQYGCGRAMWEYNPSLDRFGTPMALMLLPYWTDGCIDSMEGLLFESSATTPYHFINQAELSAQPSEAVVGLPYSGVNVALGIEHLQLMGVRYFMASSPSVQQYARENASLRLVATSGPWKAAPGSTTTASTTWDVFEVEDAPLVTPLTNEPAVMKGIKPGQSSWLDPSVAWYDDPSRWNVELAASGPSSWPRVPIGDTHPPAVPVAPTTVSDVRTSNDTISFRVSHVGTPVLVKVSYFPNWQTSGATGPYRVTPNLMVVVPTSHQVTLFYGATHANELGEVLTVLAVVILLGMVVFWVVRRRRTAGPARAPARSSGPRHRRA